jgi:perosamine synthetase
MLLTNDPQYAEKARSLTNLCFTHAQRFRHRQLGHDFRLTNVQAAIGLAQIERMEEIIARKRQIGETYNHRFRGLEGVQLPIEKRWAKQIYWMYRLVLDDRSDMDAAEFAARRSIRGIQPPPFFLGMREPPALRDRGYFAGESYPVAERLARKGLYLPSCLCLTEAEQDQVCQAVGEVFS